jgi:hypothetical protein
LQLQQQAGDIADELQNKLGKGYAGVWFDPSTGTFHIGIAPQTNSEVAKSITGEAGITPATDFESVKHTWAELETAQEEVSSQVAPLAKTQDTQVATDPRTNSIRLEVASNLPSDTIQEIESSVVSTPVPTHVVLVSPERLRFTADACKFAYCDPPLRGGVKINSTPTTEGEVAECTAGFYVQDANNYQYILTAGHCFQGHPHWNYPYAWGSANAAGKGCAMGPPIASAVNENMDAGVIEAPGPCTSIEPDIVEWGVFENYYVLPGPAKAYVGLFECHMGMTSKNQCGP